MKILGASSFTEDASRNASTGAAHHATERPMAIDFARDAVVQALAQAQLQATDIELIVALSLSPSRLADDPGFSYPRLSHPLQRDLGLSNAVVFDMMDADWSIALDLAQSFCVGLGYRYALVVRGECVDDVIDARAQALVNGAAALVLECEDASMAFFAHAQIDHPPLMALKSLDWQTMRSTGRYAQVSGSFDAGQGRFVIDPGKFQAPIATLIDELPASIAHSPRLLFCERWMGPALDPSAGRSVASVTTNDAVAPGAMFELPQVLESLIRGRPTAGDRSATFVAFTLDPFKSRIGCFAVEV